MVKSFGRIRDADRSTWFHNPAVREDSYIKPFFPTRSLSEARALAAKLGGEMRPRSEEWEARGFRACEAVDPDGNVIQFREDAR